MSLALAVIWGCAGPPPSAPQPVDVVRAPLQTAPSVAPVADAPMPEVQAVPVPDHLEGWRDVAGIDGVALDVRYATADNFAGRVLDGYARPGAWLRDVPWAGLQRSAEAARTRGFTLVVFDAYRPERASRDMVVWAEESGNTHLLKQGYIAARSGHNRGHTIDLTLAGPDGPLEMGTEYDVFTAAAHTANAEGEAAANRALLVEILAEGGFTNYRKEWWHFSHASGPWAPIDVPYGVVSDDREPTDPG